MGIAIGVALAFIGWWTVSRFVDSSSSELPDESMAWSAADGSGASVLVRSDGTGTLANLPHGRGESCRAGVTNRLAGEFEWRRYAPGKFEARIGDDYVYFGARLDGASDELDWMHLVVFTCEDEPGPNGGNAPLYSGPMLVLPRQP